MRVPLRKNQKRCPECQKGRWLSFFFDYNNNRDCVNCKFCRGESLRKSREESSEKVYNDEMTKELGEKRAKLRNFGTYPFLLVKPIVESGELKTAIYEQARKHAFVTI